MNLSFDETKALQLYNSKLNDVQIGKILNKKSNTIASWRKRRNLPSLVGVGCREEIHFSKVLTPSQSKEMKLFLNTLLQASELAKKAGTKPDVESFMKAWIGLPISEEGKRERSRLLQRESVRRRELKRA